MTYEELVRKLDLCLKLKVLLRTDNTRLKAEMADYLHLLDRHKDLKASYAELARGLDLVLADNARLKAFNAGLITFATYILELDPDSDAPMFVKAREALNPKG